MNVFRIKFAANVVDFIDEVDFEKATDHFMWDLHEAGYKVNFGAGPGRRFGNRFICYADLETDAEWGDFQDLMTYHTQDLSWFNVGAPALAA